ncbi:uncharacterized protein METZ01_LOCUS227474 [marine metagenome]|uniref:Uncharacterized protein n=1 Tax=marine metagenome TaxID=408172 RepID=A0A382GHI8_9ZZZZ
MKSLLFSIVATVLLVGCEKPQPLDISIHDAAKAGNIEAVKQHLAAGADVNAKNEGGLTPLHPAAYEGHMEIVELLIAKGADVNTKDVDGLTSLHFAASNGHKDVVELLIAEGADVNAKAADGEMPLHRATVYGNKEIVELLIANDAYVKAENKYGGTPLHEATMVGHKEIAELLIAKGADLNVKDVDGFTPVDLAKGHPEIADLLRKHGGKHCSIHTAVEGGDIEGVKEFLATGTDVNAKDDIGRTPLELAYGETADLLRKHGGKTSKELKAEGK